MVDPDQILKFSDDIARRFKPTQIILFGSYAYGSPTDDSDVDLLVVKRYRGASFRAAIRIDERLDRTFPLDLLVRSPAELERRLQMGDSFLKQIMTQGIILYDAADPRLGRKGRSRLRHRCDASPLAKANAV